MVENKTPNFGISDLCENYAKGGLSHFMSHKK